MIHNDALNYIRAADEACHELFDQDFEKDDMHIYARQAARVQVLTCVGIKLFGKDAYSHAASEFLDSKKMERIAEWAEREIHERK